MADSNQAEWRRGSTTRLFNLTGTVWSGHAFVQEEGEKIKVDIAAGVKQPDIAKKNKISRSVVSDIATGRVHKDVPWPNGEPPMPEAGGRPA